MLEHVCQTFVAIRAGLLRLVLPAREDVHQVVVRDQRPGDRHQIAVAAPDGVGDDPRGLEPAGADHRHPDRLLDLPGVGEVRPFDLVRLGGGIVPLPARQTREVAEQVIGPIGGLAARDHHVVGLDELLDRQIDAGRIARMREERPGRHVDGIDAGLHQHLADLDRLVQGVAGRADAEERDRVGVILGADLHLQVKIAADLRPDRLHDVDHEAGAVLDRSAVFVLPIVDGRAQELRDQIAIGAVELDAVEARLLRPPRALGERLDHFFDLSNRHPLAAETMGRVALVGRAQADRVFDAADVPLPPAVTELHDEPAVVLVDRLPQLAPERNVSIVIDHRVVRDDAAAQVHRYERRDDRPDSPFGELGFPVDARAGPRSVVVVEPSGDVRPDDAVLDREIAEGDRLEDRVECHGEPLGGVRADRAIRAQIRLMR